MYFIQPLTFLSSHLHHCLHSPVSGVQSNCLHIVQLTPLPSPNHIISCLIKIQNGHIYSSGLPRLYWKRGRGRVFLPVSPYHAVWYILVGGTCIQNTCIMLLYSVWPNQGRDLIIQPETEIETRRGAPLSMPITFSALSTVHMSIWRCFKFGGNWKRDSWPD